MGEPSEEVRELLRVIDHQHKALNVALLRLRLSGTAAGVNKLALIEAALRSSKRVLEQYHWDAENPTRDSAQSTEF